jgi:hypothetical protein
MRDFILIGGKRNSYERNKGKEEKEADMLRPFLYSFLIATIHYSLPFYVY